MQESRVMQDRGKQATHQDFVVPGVIYGYRAVCEYGSFSDGLGNIYNFGRSRQKALLDLECAPGTEARQKELLRTKCKRIGMNAPSRMLMWVKVKDIEKMFNDFRQQLRWCRIEVEGSSLRPEVTHQCAIGDNWYTVANVDVSDFGEWCRGLMRQLLRSETESV